MLYLPSSVTGAELDILSAPYFGGEWAVYYSFRPVVHLATLDQNAQGYVVRIASTANIASLSGLTAIDGVTPVAGDRILLKNQTTASQNGIYVAASGSWSRATDADTGDELLSGSIVQVTAGTVAAGLKYKLTTTGTITVGTTSLTFTLTTDAVATLTDDSATDLPAATVGADVQVFCTTPLRSNAATVITMATKDNQASPAVMAATATFSPQSWVNDQSFNFQRGYAVDMVPATSGATLTELTSLTTLAGGNRGVSFDFVRMPVLTDYILIGCTTDKDFNSKSRLPKGIDCGMITDAFVKRGKAAPGELSIGGKLKSFGDGLSRIDGGKVTVMMIGLKDGQTVGDRLVFTQCVLTGKPTLPDGDGEAMVKSEGKFVDNLYFIAPYSA